MKQFKKVAYFGLVIAIASLMCLQAGAISTTISSPEEKKIIPKTQGFTGTTLVSSDNPTKDDTLPRVTKNADGAIIVTYQKEYNIFKQTLPLRYSTDGGGSWTTKVETDSEALYGGSGLLTFPAMIYNPNSDEIFLTAADPMTEFGAFFSWYPGDIENAEDFLYFNAFGTDAPADNAVTYVGEWMVWLSIDDYEAFPQGPHLKYVRQFEGDFQWPSDVDGSWCAGSYYDAESQLVTSPAKNTEIDKNSGRMFMVMETQTDEGPKISYKSTYADLDPNSEFFLFTDGGGYGGMDKYADIEIWPFQQYIASDATDPDVGASGNNVCVVYVQGGQVKCKYSSDNGENFGESIIDSGACPSIYMSGSNAYCAYAKDGNLYVTKSEDGGATWGDSEKRNAVDGTVVMEDGSICIEAAGLVWTEERDGQKDVYFGAGEAASEVVISTISGGIGVKATIENVGNAPAADIPWSISLSGTVFVGGSAEGNIGTLAAGESVTVSIPFVLGIGATTITVTAGSATKTASGTILLIFITGVS